MLGLGRVPEASGVDGSDSKDQTVRIKLNKNKEKSRTGAFVLARDQKHRTRFHARGRRGKSPVSFLLNFVNPTLLCLKTVTQ